MKKTLFLAIMAGAALAGCVKNEEVAKGSSGAPERITFEAPVVSVPTRATEIYDNSTEGAGFFPKNQDFAVYALYHEGDFSAYDAADVYMKNVKCEANKKGTNETPDYWAPAENYYWPKNGKLTFAAYSPSSASTDWPTGATVAWDTDGFTFTNFKVNNTPADQIDLLYSGRVYNQTSANMLTSTNKDPYQGITIPFKHALSSIVFTARATVENAIRLTGITVYNVYSKGTFDQVLTYTQGDSGYVEGETGKWSSYSELVTATATTATTTNTDGQAVVTTVTPAGYVVYNNTSTPQVLPTDANSSTTDKFEPSYIVNNTIKDAPACVDGTRESSLIVLPQNLQKDYRTIANGYTTTGENATVVIKYQIKHKVDNVDKWLDQTATFELAVASDNPDDATPKYVWEKGKRYIYNIEIGLDKIYFNPNTTDWKDAPGTAVQIK